MKEIRPYTHIINVLKIMHTNMILLVCIFISLIASSQANEPQDVSSEAAFQSLLTQTVHQGRSRVIIELEVLSREGSQLSFATTREPRQNIRAAQAQLLRNFDLSRLGDVKQYKHLPYLAMEVDAVTLLSMRDNPKVKSIYEDKLHTTQLLDSTALIGSVTACLTGYCGQGQVVAVLDTGVEADHLFLGNVVHQACFSSTVLVNSSTTLCPNGQDEQIGTNAAAPCAVGSCYHGTHVAGIAAGNGSGAGVDFSGVAPDAELMAIQVFSQFTDPVCADFNLSSPCILSYTSDQISALEHVYDEHGNFAIASVNMSLGGGLYTDTCDLSEPAITAAINLLKSVEIATVVASGNNSSSTSISSPACISSAISVGSTTKFDAVSSFSNSAAILDLLAPGQSINSSMPGNLYGVLSGTSMATPHVAGAYAVLRSANPSASVDVILNSLKNTGAAVLDPRNNLTKPRLQIDLAINEIVVDTPPIVSITAPADGMIFTEGDAITFTAIASDTEDGDLSTSIDWVSDLDGSLGIGASISTTGLSVGTHTITASVIDSGALSGLDTLSITVNAPGGSVEVIVDNQDINTFKTGTWSTSSGPNPWDGQSVYNDSNNIFQWAPDVTEAGIYEVYAWWTYHVNRSTNVPYRVQSLDGLDAVLVNQKDVGLGGQWNLLGTYTFAEGNDGYVEVSSENGQASADAVRLVKIGGPGNLPPSVTITAPADGSAFTEGDNIIFTGIASDTEDGDLSLSIDWSSDLDGNLGIGASISSTTLSVGTHSITASVIDSGALSGLDTLSITVNAPGGPVEVIVDNQDINTSKTGTWSTSSGPNPWDGQSVYNDSNNIFQWTPDVTEAGIYEVYVWWTYHVNRSTNVPYRVQSLDGLDTVLVNQKDVDLGGQWNLLGTYTFAEGNGGYVEVSSENGQASADAVQLVKIGEPGNLSPSVTITAPADASMFTEGDNIIFTGMASDTEDGDLSLSIDWSSDLDGSLGIGASINSVNLSVGTHTITASVIDSGALSGLDTISITVNAPGGPVEVIVDNQDINTSKTGTWSISSGPNPWDGQSVYNNSNNTFQWTPDVTEAGTYEVYAWWTYHVNRSTNVPFRVQSLDGLDMVLVNQKDVDLGGQWNLLGTYTFAAGSDGYVEVSSENGQASADAVRLVKIN